MYFQTFTFQSHMVLDSQLDNLSHNLDIFWLKDVDHNHNHHISFSFSPSRKHQPDSINDSMKSITLSKQSLQRLFIPCSSVRLIQVYN